MNEDYEPTPPTPTHVRIIRGAVALVAILGMLYLFGGIEYLTRFQRTPPAATQPVIESQLDARTIQLPINVFVLRHKTLGSRRSEESVLSIIKNANNIWQQANINLQTDNIIDLQATEQDIKLFSSSPRRFIASVEAYDPNKVNVFLVRTIGGGINGLSYTGTNAVAVADFTSVNDFRVLAHEIGHALGLNHVPNNRSQLMYRGANGVILSESEMAHARLTALSLN